MYLIEGLFLGFASILLIGPVVFILINASIYNGKKAGISVALGIILGDIIYTIACFKGLDYITNSETFNTYVSYIGFVILFSLGLIYTFKKHRKVNEKDFNPKNELLLNFIKGFSINFFNPFVLSVWLFVANYAKTNFSDESVSFLAAALLGIFLIDLAKVFLSKYLKDFISSNKLMIFYKISGIIMILFSLRILYFLISKTTLS